MQLPMHNYQNGRKQKMLLRIQHKDNIYTLLVGVYYSKEHSDNFQKVECPYFHDLVILSQFSLRDFYIYAYEIKSKFISGLLARQNFENDLHLSYTYWLF